MSRNDLKSKNQSQSGQSVIEFILLLSLTVFAASTMRKVILSVVDDGIGNLGAQLERDLRTGSGDPASLWGEPPAS